MTRTIAIGDIHGCSLAFQALVDAIATALVVVSGRIWQANESGIIRST